MSRAFVKDGAESAGLDLLPDRPISPHRNLVTARGLWRIESRVAEFQAALAKATAAADRTAIAKLSRELRYWSARRASAELAVPDPDARTVVFGMAVTVQREDGGARRWRIVGEDEAEPEAGRIAWTTPVARALLGAEIGDLRLLPTGEVEILALEPRPERDDAL